MVEFLVTWAVMYGLVAFFILAGGGPVTVGVYRLYRYGHQHHWYDHVPWGLGMFQGGLILGGGGYLYLAH